MNTLHETPQAFDIKIGFGQLASPFGALPGSLAYVFRRAIGDAGIEWEDFSERLSKYVQEQNPNVGNSGVETLASEAIHRFSQVDLSWTDFLMAMSLIGYKELRMNFS